MGDDARLPEQAVTHLGLEKLVEVFLNPRKTVHDEWYTFLGIGEITIHYDATFVEEKSALAVYAARLAGADGTHHAERGAYTSAHLEGQVPAKTTHYCLGSKIAQEESYRNKKAAFSCDVVPIVFLSVKK